MSSYEFIIDGLRYSFSTLSGYESCPQSFKLAKIDLVPRVNNFYAEFGTLIHECMEKYFKGELESFEISQYYTDNWHSSINTHLPINQLYLEDRYKQQGQDFFDFFYFDKTGYDVLSVEDNIEYSFFGYPFIAKPDLVLHNKETDKLVLIDYKTSAPWKKDKKKGTEKMDKEKIEGYVKQMYTYTYALRKYRDLPIDKVTLWFPRLDKTYSFDVDKNKETEVMFWLKDNIEKLRSDEKFVANNQNSYFCNILCGVRDSCAYRAKNY